MSTATETSIHPFVITREVNAPRERVFKFWTDSNHLSWFGPKGVTMTHTKIDPRPGGTHHFCMRTSDGHEMWAKWAIREVEAPKRLVFISSFSDEKGGTTRHPMSPTWPLEMLSTVTFEEKNGKTLITVQWVPQNASAEEIQSFNKGHASMRQGWTGTFERLEEYIATAT